MNTPQMREAITAAYQSERWVAKVKAMTDKQVIAVYFRLLYLGRLTK